MTSVTWYLKRIRAMTAKEVGYRVGQQISQIILRIESFTAERRVSSSLEEDPMQLRFCRERQPLLPLLPFDAQGLEQAKDSLMRGEIRVAGNGWQWVNTPDIWHRAPDTGHTWPDVFFGRIGYREGNPYGDVRLVWEPSRLQHLVDLAMLARTGSAEERQEAARLASAQITSWVRANPPLSGPHYISSMECALRLIALCHALDILRNELDEASWRALVAVVRGHAPFIERRLSRYSSTGNHTVAEAAGLVYAGVLFPEMKDADRWLMKGTALLADCAREQILPDGGGAEQAFCYHYFNIQIMSLVSELLKHHGRPTPTDISSAVDRGTAFLRDMGLATDQLPPIGDADGGHALSKHLQLSGIFVRSAADARIFPDSGYTAACIARRPRVTLVFDHGDLGMPPVYGHGHADALSVLLRVNGEDLLVDPGTYTYTGDGTWRRYFRGTSAHNTVTVAGKDQARQDGCFLWTRPYKTRLLASELDSGSGGRLVARHDGYRDIGVTHVRGIAWLQGQWLVVRDILLGEGAHSLQLHWHLSAQPEWRDAQSFCLTTAGGTLAIRCHGGLISSHHGEREPISGWRSASYGVREPITTVRVSRTGPLPHKFDTLVSLHGKPITDTAMEESLKWIEDRAHRQ